MSKRQKSEVVYTEGEGWVNPPDNIDKLGEKWDNALSIYKEWLEVTDPGQYRSLIEKTMTSTESYKQPEAAEYTPFGDESKDVYAITYLIPYSEWRESDPGAPRHGTIGSRGSKNRGRWRRLSMVLLTNIIDRPVCRRSIKLKKYPTIEITKTNWGKFIKFSQSLLKGWNVFKEEGALPCS